jgi:hypothetical protein
LLCFVRVCVTASYELQLEAEVQRKGLGRFLMSLVELFAWRCQLLRVVLTVFHSNKAALHLYRNTLHYELDETDPTLWGHNHEQYTILAKKSKKILSISDIVLPLIPAATATTAAPSTSAVGSIAAADSAAATVVATP